MINAVYPTILTQTALPFYLTGAGICDPEFSVCRESGLVSHQILYTESGCGILDVCGQSHKLCAGSLFYLAPRIPHQYRPLDGAWRTCWVVFRGDELAQIMPRLGFKDYAVAHGALTKEMQTLFAQILAAANNPLDADKCSLLTYEYVLAARKALFFPAARSSQPIQRVFEYIGEHFGEDIELSQLIELWANGRAVTPQHFCRVFKSAAGMRPMEYIARKRVAHAKLLLWNTDYSAAKIGEICGYRDPTYFGQVFRKYEGISPIEYRNKRGTDII